MANNLTTSESKLRDKEKRIKQAEERLERQKKQLQKERRLLSDKRRKEYNHKTFVFGGLVRKAGLSNVSDDVLLGAFLAIEQRVNSDKDADISTVQQWATIGENLINDSNQRGPARLVINTKEYPERSELARVRELGFRKKGVGVWEGDVLPEKANSYAYEFRRKIVFLPAKKGSK